MSSTLNGSLDDVLGDYEKHGALHDMFVRQALKTPDQVRAMVHLYLVRCVEPQWESWRNQNLSKFQVTFWFGDKSFFY